MKQIPLNIRLENHTTFDDYFTGPNAELVARLKNAAQNKQTEGAIYCWGGIGSGKSHLLQAVCHETRRNGGVSFYLPMQQLKDESPAMLENLEEAALIAIDDIDVCVGDQNWEHGFFHLFNRAYEKGSQLIFSARTTVAYAGFQLPDLSSRLSWGFVYHLLDLNDEERVLALQKTARQRGIDLPQSVAVFLLRRIPRSSASLFNILNELDQASLSAQRKLTVPFVKQWLAEKALTGQELSFF